MLCQLTGVIITYILTYTSQSSTGDEHVHADHVVINVLTWKIDESIRVKHMSHVEHTNGHVGVELNQ